MSRLDLSVYKLSRRTTMRLTYEIDGYDESN